MASLADLLGAATSGLRKRPLGADIVGMSRRALLTLFGWVSAGLTYLVAAGASGGVPAYAADCVGLTSLVHWFESSCEPALVPRLFIVGIGAIPTILLFYFASRDEPPRSMLAGMSDASSSRQRSQAPDVTRSITWIRKGDRFLLGHTPARGFGIWDKSNPGPPVQRFPNEVDGRSRAEARFRELEPTGRLYQARSSGNAYGFQGDSGPASTDTNPKQPQTPQVMPVEAEPALKTCPDCAEQVRFAARKCRFCGFLFVVDEGEGSAVTSIHGSG